ncbi:MAG: radical SAM protein, partial [Clostridia bacterium]|nr:radical SAM protein [Clostridia bacterium]
GAEYSADEVARRALRYRNYFSDTGGITVSGGEPLLQIEFVTELFQKLKAEGINTCLDTSGCTFSEEKKAEFLPLLSVTDLVLLDIKHIDGAEHEKLTGKSNKNTLAFAKFLSDNGKKMWIRHVLVPELTDRDEWLKKLRAFMDTLQTVEKIEVLPYHTMGEIKYEKLGYAYPLKGVVPPTKDRIENAKRILGAGGKDGAQE